MTKAKRTKQSRLISMLKKGVRLSQLSKSLEWQPHTVRAAITRLRQDGWTIRRTVEKGQSTYKIDAPRSKSNAATS